MLSDDGRALFERCGPALREIADVERDLADPAAGVTVALEVRVEP